VFAEISKNLASCRFEDIILLNNQNNYVGNLNMNNVARRISLLPSAFSIHMIINNGNNIYS